MSGVYLSAACVGYDDFARLACLCRELHVGAELSLRLEQPGFAEALRQNLPLFSRIPLTLHGPYTGIDAAAEAHSSQWEHLMSACKTAFELYKEAGADSLVFHTHSATYTPRSDHCTLRRNAAANMARMAENAAKQNINIIFENVGIRTDGDLIFEEKAFIDLFAQLPDSAGCLLDVGHALINSWDVFHIAHALGNRIRTFHLHNNDGLSDQHRPLFEAGNRYAPHEMAALLPILHSCAPDAAMVLEYKPFDGLTDAILKNDVRHLQRIAN